MPAELEMTDESFSTQAARRGRPKTRVSVRADQVSQNMRLHRARKAAELEALGKTLNALEKALDSGDAQRLLRAAAAVCGVWTGGRLRESVARALAKRAAPQNVGG